MYADIFDAFDLDVPQKISKGLGDYHLRSALVYPNLDQMEAGKGRKREISCYHVLKKFGDISGVCDPSSLLVRIIKSDKISRIPESIINDAIKIFELDNDYLKNSGMSEREGGFDRVLRAVHRIKFLPYVAMMTKLMSGLLYLNALCSEREFHITIPDCHKENGLTVMEIANYEILLAGELLGVRQKYSNKIKIITLDMYRMITDKITERFNVILSSAIGAQVFNDIYPSPKLLMRVFSLFDDHILSVGNAAYKDLKAFEAILTGLILKQGKSDIIPADKFLNDTLNGIDEPGRSVYIELITLLDGRPLHHLSQICGMFRLWGHPVVNAKSGVEKVRKIGRISKVIDQEVVKVSGRKFKEIFYMEYFNKNGGNYPSCQIKQGATSYISEQIKSKDPINKKDYRYDLQDWDEISSTKTFDIPASYNLSMIVSDTAISPTRSEIQDAIKSGKSITDAFIRRGVLKWMKDGMLDCHWLLNFVNDCECGLPKEYLISGLYEKERELNPVARMFTLMSLMMRSYVVVTEGMLADHILDLIPGITMTYDLLSLSKEMILNTKKQHTQGQFSKTFCINMDFEKWNLNMRKESTLDVFTEIGKLFGLPELYNRTYDIFENSIIYLANGSYLPKMDDNNELTESDPDLAYQGHKGGFEGLRQKGWTIFTVILIKYVCDRLGIKYTLMGQGDNQVLMATIYTKSRKYDQDSEQGAREIRDTLMRLINDLTSIFGKVGLPLKPLETWISEDFFSYGKTPLFRGIPLATSLKRLSRVFPFSNEDLMTLDNAMGAIGANTQSASMTDCHPAVSLFIGRLQQSICINVFLQYHPLTGMGLSSNLRSKFVNFKLRTQKGQYFSDERERLLNKDDIKRLIMLIPKTLGGYNTFVPCELIVRGFPDPVSRDMDFMFKIAEGCSHDRNLQNAIINWISVLFSPTEDYMHLIQDPVSLNLLIPPRSNMVVKKAVRESIKQMGFKSDFASWFYEVMGVSDNECIRELVECLTEHEDLNVRLLHDIVGSTIYGYAESVTSKIDKTVTLSRIVTSNQDVVSKLMTGEDKFFNYFCWRSEYSDGELIDWECSSRYVRTIRNKGWKKNVQTVSTPFPFSFMTTDRSSTDRPDSFMEVVMSDLSLGNVERIFCQLGQALPYLGSNVKEKLHSTAARMAFGSEPLITRPVRLTRTIGWFVDEDSEIAEVIRELVRAVTNIDPNTMISIPEFVKGHMMHRYRDFALKHGAMWMPLFGSVSHMSISSNNFLEYAKGTKNVTMHFQSLMCALQFMMLENQVSGIPQKIIKWYRSCKCCVTHVDDCEQQLTKHDWKKLIPSLKSNPYLYLDKSSITLIVDHRERQLQEIRKISLENLSCNLTTLYETGNDMIAGDLALDIVYGRESSSESSDIGTLSRTIFLKLDLNTLFTRTIYYVYILMLKSEMKPEHGLPSLVKMKKKIIRRIHQAGHSSFLSVSGIFGWEESINSFSALKYAIMPMSFPIDPTSACRSIQSTLINLLKSDFHMLEWRNNIIIESSRWSSSPKIKSIWAFKNNLTMRSKCYWCCHTVLKLNNVMGRNLKDIESIKCLRGHQALPLERFKTVIICRVTLEELFDKLPILNYLGKDRQQWIKVPISTRNSEILLSDDSIVDRSPQKRQIIINQKNEMATMILLLRQRIVWPTRSLFRIYDIFCSLPQLQGMTGNILMLGDGYGYSSLMIDALTGSSTVYSTSLLDVSKSISHCARLIKPPSHLGISTSIDYSLLLEVSTKLEVLVSSEKDLNILKSKEFSLIVSEIEFLYSDQSSYGSIVELGHKCGVDRLLFKIQVSVECDMASIIQCVEKHYIRWEIRETGSDNRYTGHLWMYCHGVKKQADKIDTYLGEQTIEVLKIRTMMNDSVDDNWDQLRMMLHAPLERVCVGGVIEYFASRQITGYDHQDHTVLYHCLKTGRRPEEIMKAGGNEAYYLRSDDEINIRDALLVIGLCRLIEISDIILALRSNWNLKWSMNLAKGPQRWSPYVTRCKGQIRHKTKMDILRMIGIMREYFVFPEKWPLYKNVGNRIQFKYTPKEKDDFNFMYFKISKMSSYKAGE
ncbi:polymerase protein [paper mulberry mosaic associated virus]|uniref:RNA-directed RNA polymerase n=1 Tax=paper mulberry mosaic associated virus TaxID=3071215 RepID=A0AAE7JMN5_9RHAB|nr:polymerase protein [paper mulberry mosaic associated virus]QNO38995.1 polymerase protein [paper mulberry mosaic associated virus]